MELSSKTLPHLSQLIHPTKDTQLGHWVTQLGLWVTQLGHHHLPSTVTLLNLPLAIFDFLTMRKLLNLSRYRTLVLLGTVFIFLLGLQTMQEISRRFEKLNRTINSLKEDVNVYKRRAYYNEKKAQTTIQHKIAQDILQGLGPAIVKPNVNKESNQTQGSAEGSNLERQPFTPNGSVSDIQKKYVNPHDFKYILNNEKICAGEKISYIIYVHTAPNHFSRRTTLRETWGQQNLFIGHPSRIVFFLGTTDNVTQEKIEEEYKQYGDIVQEDYKDDYHNLTYKGIGALKWISTYCNQTKYVFKSDDDTYLNIFMLMHLFKTQYSEERKFIMCMWWDNMPIMRAVDKNCAKWCMNGRVFPGRKFFPRYCSGAAYFFSSDVISEMYSASLKIPFFWVDDVYITGLLTKKVKDIKWLQEINRYRYSVDAFRDEYKNGKVLNWMVTVTKDESQIREFWYLTLKRLDQESIELIGDDKYNKILEESKTQVQIS